MHFSPVSTRLLPRPDPQIRSRSSTRDLLDPPARRSLRPAWRLLALAAVWLGTGYAVDRLVCRAPETPAEIQGLVCVAFAVLSCALLVELAAIAGFPARSRWEFLPPAAAYAALWGRHHFLNFFYWDEILRFGSTRLSIGQLLHSLLFPVANGHVMPFARVYWYAIYSVFRADYIGVAGASFVAAIATIASAQALLRIVAPSRPRYLALAVATLLAATPHSPIVTLWKGAGDSLLLAMATFLPAAAILAGAVTGRIAFDRRALGWSTVLLTTSLFSSSVLTEMPIFLFPFAVALLVGGPTARKVRAGFAILFALVLVETCAYWYLRQSVVGLPFPAGEWGWRGLVGALAGTLEMFLPARALVVLFALGSTAMTVRLAATLIEPLRRRSSRTERSSIDPTTILWLLGIEMYAAGTFEVVLARGMLYEVRDVFGGYHLYLAFWGLALASASMVVAAGSALRRLVPDGRRGRTARLASMTAIATGLALYCAFQHYRVKRLWPLLTAFPLDHACAPETLPQGRTRITVIRAREDMREDLKRYVDGAIAIAGREQRRADIPDLSLMDSPRYDELALWPKVMDTDPRYAVDYRMMSKLGYLLRVFGTLPWGAPGLPLRLVPIEKIDRATLAALYADVATGPFLKKYWPQFEPASN
jgi:hypothetical protein